jgi:ABC-type transport system involved in cytochrome bd biosynthesis fused ATPase/permease subunit
MTGMTFVCSVLGAIPGETTVSGDSYLQTNFGYSYSHIWRNLGILIAFWIFFLLTYLFAAGLNIPTSEHIEGLLFLRCRRPKRILANEIPQIEESAYQNDSNHNSENDLSIHIIPTPKTFSWRDVTYDIGRKANPRRLLNQVSGYAESGTLTALMGTSGAGKTTLLDALARRLLVGIVGGHLSIEGIQVGRDFESKIGKVVDALAQLCLLIKSKGYVQQQDLHLETATVREALRFSATLRRPKSVPLIVKHEWVEEVIKV